MMKLAGKTETLGSYLLKSLSTHGVEHIFGIPGDYILGFDRLIEESQIQFINTTRENTAGNIADAYARVRGLGVVCITYGVGINIANAIAQCYVENSPVILISGAPGKEEIKKCPIMHHFLNESVKTQSEIFSKITATQCILDNPKTAQSEINRVIKACLHEKKPVYIELPRDTTPLEILTHPEFIHDWSRPNPLKVQEAVEETAELLQKARNPIIWAGNLVQRFGLADELLKFAESYQIPIASTLLAKGVISERHPLCLGVYQGAISPEEIQKFFEKSDLILLLGEDLSDVNTGIHTAKISHIPQVIVAGNQVKIKQHVYQDVSVTNFIQGLNDLDLNLKFTRKLPESSNFPIEQFAPKGKTKITSNRLFECLKSHLDPNHILVSDVGDCLFGATNCIVEQDHFLANALFTSLGWSVPASIGASLAAPRKRVIALVGDGAFQLSGIELSTAVRFGLDPIIILLNNHGYTTERFLMEGKFNDLPNWNYTELPKLIGGGKAIKVKTEEEMEKGLKEALCHRGSFYLIEVELDKLDRTLELDRFLKACTPNP